MDLDVFDYDILQNSRHVLIDKLATKIHGGGLLLATELEVVSVARRTVILSGSFFLSNQQLSGRSETIYFASIFL
jgi:hypothetical protein